VFFTHTFELSVCHSRYVCLCVRCQRNTCGGIIIRMRFDEKQSELFWCALKVCVCVLWCELFLVMFVALCSIIQLSAIHIHIF